MMMPDAVFETNVEPAIDAGDDTQILVSRVEEMVEGVSNEAQRGEDSAEDGAQQDAILQARNAQLNTSLLKVWKNAIFGASTKVHSTLSTPSTVLALVHGKP